MELTIVRNYDGMDVDELECEMQDMYNALEDEKQWCIIDKASETVHMENIKKLYEEIAYIRKLIREVRSC